MGVQPIVSAKLVCGPSAIKALNMFENELRPPGLGARVGSPDLATFGAGMPLVDGRVILRSRVSATPGSISDLIP